MVVAGRRVGLPRRSAWKTLVYRCLLVVLSAAWPHGSSRNVSRVYPCLACIRLMPALRILFLRTLAESVSFNGSTCLDFLRFLRSFYVVDISSTILMCIPQGLLLRRANPHISAKAFSVEVCYAYRALFYERKATIPECSHSG